MQPKARRGREVVIGLALLPVLRAEAHAKGDYSSKWWGINPGPESKMFLLGAPRNPDEERTNYWSSFEHDLPEEIEARPMAIGRTSDMSTFLPGKIKFELPTTWSIIDYIWFCFFPRWKKVNWNRCTAGGALDVGHLIWISKKLSSLWPCAQSNWIENCIKLFQSLDEHYLLQYW